MSEARDLNEREQLILQAVVNSYITTADPVGSRSVVKRFDLGLSPATVRNVMADLEEMGYLQQIHTSSGRIPTDAGYRYYVSFLMQAHELTLRERSRIEDEFTAKLNDADEVLQHTSQLLAERGFDVVLLDRYVASNAAYSAARLHQGADGDVVSWVGELEFGRFGLPKPDHQLLLDVSVELAAERARQRAADDAARARDAYERDGGLQQRTGAVYAQLAAAGWAGPWQVLGRDVDAAEVAAGFFA